MKYQLIINNQPVTLKSSNNNLFTDSLTIAKVFEKEHKNVLTKIESKLHLFNELNFKLVKYTDNKGEKRPAYYLDRDFFSLNDSLVLNEGIN